MLNVGLTQPETGSPAPAYVRGPVERFGRRMKMEYVGMTSVFTVICLLFFGDAPLWPDAVAATAGSFFFFMGLKKKTRDHLMVSFLLFASASLAIAPVVGARWSVPYLMFGVSVWALEGYLEKRRNRIFALPVVFGLWAAVDPSWLLGLVFVAAYLTEARGELPGLRRRLGWLAAAAAVVAAAVWIWRFAPAAAVPALLPPERLALDPLGLILFLSLGLPTLLGLAAYWRELAGPHRWNTLVFGILAPLDARLLAAFGVVASILLAATVLRNSADSESMRPFLKHAEWHFFWWALLLACYAVLRSTTHIAG